MSTQQQRDAQRDADQKQEICAAMDSYVKNEEPFTALDITLAVNKNTFIPHRAVREIVKNEFTADPNSLFQEYTSSIIEVELADGSTAKSILYHHHNFDSNNYAERSKTLNDVQSAPSPAPVTFPAPTVAVPKVDGDATKLAQKLLDDLSSPSTSKLGDSVSDDLLNFNK